GRGKQIFAIYPRVMPGGTITGLDLSEEALRHVNARAAAEGLGHIHTLHGSLDDWRTLIWGRSFHAILSSYAIYYAKDMKGLLRGVADYLRPGGQLFVCGYAAGTNQELLGLAASLVAGHPKTRPVRDFISPEDLGAI